MVSDRGLSFSCTSRKWLVQERGTEPMLTLDSVRTEAEDLRQERVICAKLKQVINLTGHCT